MTATNDSAIGGEAARLWWVLALRWHIEDQQQSAKKLKLEPKRRARATAQRRAK